MSTRGVRGGCEREDGVTQLPANFAMPLYRQTIALYEKLFAIYQTYSIMSNTSYLAKTVSAL